MFIFYLSIAYQNLSYQKGVYEEKFHNENHGKEGNTLGNQQMAKWDFHSNLDLRWYAPHSCDNPLHQEPHSQKVELACQIMGFTLVKVLGVALYEDFLINASICQSHQGLATIICQKTIQL